MTFFPTVFTQQVAVASHAISTAWSGNRKPSILATSLFWAFFGHDFSPKKSPLPDAMHTHCQPGHSFFLNPSLSSKGFARAKAQPVRLYCPNFVSSRASRGTAPIRGAAHGARTFMQTPPCYLHRGEKLHSYIFFSSPPRASSCRAGVLLPHKVTDLAFALAAARFGDIFTGTPASRRAELYLTLLYLSLFLEEAPAPTSAALQD